MAKVSKKPTVDKEAMKTAVAYNRAAEDAEAAKAAKASAALAEQARNEGNNALAADIEQQANRDGLSVLGKNAVIVQDAHGNPVVARRGEPVTTRSASATDPALMANEPPESSRS